MKAAQFGVGYWLFSCGSGLALTLLLFQLTETVAEPVASSLLWPGAELATVTGFGSHDLEGFLLYILGNVVFYCALFLGLFKWLTIGAKVPTKS